MALFFKGDCVCVRRVALSKVTTLLAGERNKCLTGNILNCKNISIRPLRQAGVRADRLSILVADALIDSDNVMTREG